MSHFFYTDAHLLLYPAIVKRRATTELSKLLPLRIKP